MLTIARAASMEIVGPTKTLQIGRLTLVSAPQPCGVTPSKGGGNAPGPTLALGPWLFSARPDHSTRLTTSCWAHWFGALCVDAGYTDVTHHRLSHSAAGVGVRRRHPAGRYRLGYRDAATTLRTYSHVLPLTDADAAATLNQLYEA